MKIVYLLAALLAFPATAGAAEYHSKLADFDAYTCRDRKIAVELHDVLTRKPLVSAGFAGKLMTEGHCFPIANAVRFEVLRFETFTVLLGPQRVAVARLPLGDGSFSYFYIMAEDIEPATPPKP